jgi:hypothetical protein
MAVGLQDSIHQSLRTLGGLDDARNLFAELNYGYADNLIPSAGWPEAAQSALADDPPDHRPARRLPDHLLPARRSVPATVYSTRSHPATPADESLRPVPLLRRRRV